MTQNGLSQVRKTLHFGYVADLAGGCIFVSACFLAPYIYFKAASFCNECCLFLFHMLLILVDASAMSMWLLLARCC